MRIPHWPALVCGWMLAAMLGQTVLADEPADRSSGGVSQADGIDDAGLDDSRELEPAGGGFAPFQQAQFDNGPYGGFGPVPVAPADGAYGQGMPPGNAWPEPSPFSQHRLQETYNSGGLWNYNAADNFDRVWFATAEYLYGHGLKPGNHNIGSDDFHFQDFFVGAPNVFRQQTTSLFGNPFHNGVKARYGYENPDGSGLTLSGFWLFESSVDNGLVMPHAIANRIDTLTPLASIVLENGDNTATNVPFDTRFFQKFTQEIGGADIDYYLAPFFTRQSFKLQLLYGAKYLRIHEDFVVQASDSGLGYLVDIANDRIITSTITNVGINPYTLLITSSSTSNLVGPHIGLRYDVGGNKFKIWGQSKVGAAANVERLAVSGLNVVQGFQAGGAFSPPTLHTRSNTHISPFFDTSINVEFPAFAMIPYINQWQMFKNAKLRIGYNFVFVGEVTRAASDIVYAYGDPLIRTDRRTWFEYNAVNFAVDWRF
ncbi:MAG TPA: BBP7 family outer membrane beta-barrel protein [Planctomycetaceae bacterium]|nr:BBP7 family outer membrane beta-barrel protein [Planctomycetaceae bacterium]